MSELRTALRLYAYKIFQAKAKERGFKGPYISTGDYYDIENNNATSRFNKNCMVLYMNPEPALVGVFKQEFGDIKNAWLSMTAANSVTVLNKVPTDIILLTKKNLIEFVNQEFTGDALFELMCLLDDEFKQKIIDKRKQQSSLFMANIDSYPLYKDGSRECELVHLLHALRYENEDIGTVVKYYHENHMNDFPRNLLDKGVFHDNRMYLPWDEEICLVLSKNPYDYIWASTGNGYQSCFSLESDYWGIQAMPMLATQPWHFMLYWSRCTLMEYSIMNHKFKLPNIQQRMWAYKGGDGLAVDKMYGKGCYVDEQMQLLRLMYPEFHTKNCHIDMNVNDFKDIVRKYRTYLDSLEYIGDYVRGDGERAFTTDIDERYVIKDSVSNITFNPNLRWKEGLIKKLHNKFCYANVCPKTKLPTEDGEHWAAKYIDKPVKSMAIYGYQADGTRDRLILVEFSHFSSRSDFDYWYSLDYVLSRNKDLNDLKKALTECQANHPQVDCILLRIVDKNKVTFQPFYARKEPLYK